MNELLDEGRVLAQERANDMGESMAVDSDKYYPRDINAAARENSHGGRPRETFRPARLFSLPREIFSGRK